MNTTVNPIVFRRPIKDIFCCLTFCFFFMAFGSAQTQKPNVLMIVLDDLNDYIEALDGHPQALTPNIKKLADEGLLFTNAHSNSPLCKPSRASFLTGLLPSTTQFFGNVSGSNWRKNEVIENSKTISEYFKENGYTTYKTGKVSHNTTSENERWDHILAASLNYGPFAYNGNNTVIHPQTVLAYADNTGPLDGTLARLSEIPEVPADETNPGYKGWWSNNAPFAYTDDNNRDAMPDEESVAWTQNNITSLDAGNSTDPFFMAVGIIRPHSPFVVPDKYYDMFPLEEVQIPVIRRNDRDDTHFGDDKSGYTLFEILDVSYTDRQKALRKKTQAYLACMAFADDMVGQLLETLDNSSFANNTMVMLFSDHGYHIGEKQYLRKHTLWEESTRVPLIIRHPDYVQNAGKKVDHPVSLVDIYPTLKDLCHLSGDTKKNLNGADLDGHSLQPFLTDPNSTSWQGPAVALTNTYIWGNTSVDGQDYSVRSKKYRYIRYQSGKEELYDHTYDPYEWKNLANEADYSSLKTDLELALQEALISDDTVLDTIVHDEMINNAKMLSISSNWSFTALTTDNLANDPEQIQRINLSDGEIIYDATNADTFSVDFWGIKDQTTAQYGTIKAYTSTDNLVYNEIALHTTESAYTGYRRLFYIRPETPLAAGTKYLKIVLTGGDQSWKGLIGSIALFDEQTLTPTDFSYIDEMVVNPDLSLFDFKDSDLRTNENGLPNFSDDLSDTSKMYRSSGNFSFSSIDPDNYDGDTHRLVRSNTNPQDVELVYHVDKLNHYRIEFWTLESRSLEKISETTGYISTYISNNQDLSEDYTEVPLKFVRIKMRTVNEGQANETKWIKYALVPVEEINTDVKFLKISITGGTAGNMPEGQYGAIHLYNASLNKVVDLNLSTEDSQKANIGIYPVPTNAILNIHGLDKATKTEIFNVLGKLVLQTKTKDFINVSNLPNGLYFLKIKGLISVRFIKQ